MIISRKHINGVEVLTGENDHIKFEIVPSAGGKITSVFNKDLKKEFLWRNANLSLETHQPGADYDANFIGGIDELLPNDIRETVDSITYPDHGELWTTPLDHELTEDRISVYGKLKLSELYYKKTISLEAHTPVINLKYTIRNESHSIRNFLWKLHAALKIEEGDRLLSSAKKSKVVDLAYSRFKNLNEFTWPFLEDTDASIIPANNNSIDFFYLYDIEKPEMNLLSNGGKHQFRYTYDKKVFPYQWYFASYGGFQNHYTSILEPASSMPISINEAKQLKQCSVLQPGQEINTLVQIYAGENINK